MNENKTSCMHLYLMIEKTNNKFIELEKLTIRTMTLT